MKLRSIYTYPCGLIAKCLTKTGTYLCRIWPWGGLCFSKAGLDVWIHAVKVSQKNTKDWNWGAMAIVAVCLLIGLCLGTCGN